MALAGLWHGAAWPFVLWGCFHGALLGLAVVRRHLAARFDRGSDTPRAEMTIVGRLVRVAFVFHLTLIGSLIFRSPELATIGTMWSEIKARGIGPGVDTRAFVILVVACLIHFVPDRLKAQCESTYADLNPLLQGAIAALVIALIATAMGSAQPYFYFQF
jgi:alginate O-acetyltransferase complex protein AlgI